MIISVFWDITRCSSVKVNRCSGEHACRVLPATSFRWLILYPEDGGDIFLRNVGWLPTENTALSSRRYPLMWESQILHIAYYLLISSLFIDAVIPDYVALNVMIIWSCCGIISGTISTSVWNDLGNHENIIRGSQYSCWDSNLSAQEYKSHTYTTACATCSLKHMQSEKKQYYCT
jgi:hypothetical protein